MSSRNQVSITDLNKISKKLVKSFFPSNDIYSLLVLSLVTVTKYSHKKYHLSAQTRIDLASEFVPDLIQLLISDEVITEDIGEELNNQYQNKREEIPMILQAYIFASGGLNVKIEPKSEKNKCNTM